MKKLNRGLSNITDLLSSQGVNILVIAVVMALAGLAYYMFNTTTEVSLLSTVMNETRNLRSSDGYGTDDYIPAIIKGGNIAKSYTVTNGHIYNKYGGLVTSNGNGVGFIVSDTQLPQGQCLKIAKALGTADLLSTQINSTTFTGEVTGADAASACVDGNNTLTFTTRS
ncbi:conjugal transfer protein [Pantoea ananatis 15320]|uniref:type 4 pilus major pilin n=1 Tax=Pantoea ananas TaxID=553 RepID=UPI000420A511|nr:type 4 pilus major pilin [Pantoea ananatis]PKC36297.1 conjugal transfer protein [Pantoea ananatis 15320]